MVRGVRKRKDYTLIDLFSGAGGLSLGFSPSFGRRFKSVWANDTSESAAATYNANFPGGHCTVGKIEELIECSETRIPKADVVIGGPPCQGFSLLNKKRLSDERKQLWRPFLRVVEIAEAGVFVMENVQQILRSTEHDQIVCAAEKQGFKVLSGKLLAANYGVPQLRYRAFIVGCRMADPSDSFPPPRTHFDPAKPTLPGLGVYVDDPSPWRTVRDAIGDLIRPYGKSFRDMDPPYDLHFRRTPTEVSRLRYRAVPREGMNRFDLQRVAPELTPRCWIKKTSGGTDLFGRLWWDRPSSTIRTEFFKPEKGRYLHPRHHRPITHREAARIQSFPDDFRFCGSKIEVARQIGNAVPPLLAAAVAGCVETLLAERESSVARSR